MIMKGREFLKSASNESDGDDVETSKQFIEDSMSDVSVELHDLFVSLVQTFDISTENQNNYV